MSLFLKQMDQADVLHIIAQGQKGRRAVVHHSVR